MWLPSLGLVISRTRPPRLQSDVAVRLEMLGKIQMTSLLLVVEAMHTFVSGQCATPMEINGGVDQFQSPNFGEEYGKKADCAWRFSSSSWTKYALKLDVKKLKLYFIQNGKVCVHGSYNLSINGDPIECKKFARESSNVTFCQTYYNSETCKSLSDVTGCEVSRKTKFPVEVKYNSDGRTITNDSALTMWGFKIGYQFIQCPDVLPTTQPETTTLSATTTLENAAMVPGATTIEDESMVPAATTVEDGANTVDDNATPDVAAYGKTSATSSTSSPVPTAGFPLPLVVGAAGGGVVSLLLIIIVIIVCMKRRASSKSKLDQETGPTAHNSEIQMEKLEETDTEESVAHTVISRSSENSTGNTRDESSPASHDAKKNPTYTAIKRDHKTGTPTTKQDSAISNDIYATPKKSKGKKLAAINFANSTNQQSELTFEPESAYIIMTGNSPVKSPAQNSGHKEDSAYSVVDVKQKPQDIYAVSTKSKKHQSSNEPEQDSTYTEISHAHKKIPKSSAKDQKSNDAGNIYTTIVKNPAKNNIAGKSAQSESSSLHHAQEKNGDVYTVPAKNKKHKSANEPEHSTYTEINHAHKKKPKTSAGQTKGVKQKPQDIYALPTKGKKHQSSIEPEQDSAYTEISHANKMIPIASVSSQKNNEASDIYTTISKNPAKNNITGKSAQSESSSLHHAQEKNGDIYAVPTKNKKHQSGNEPEQDSTYTEINHAHKKKPKTSAGQTKGVKQKPQDLYAVPAKSKKHQSSIEPEQDSTYTEISHAPKRTPKISSSGQKSNEGGDLYTVIQKNPAKKSPLLHHTQKQKDDHKATEQSGDVYAAVEHSSGVKKTIHYEKEMKDNVLYVAAP